ncbi:MAG: hypothetical protein BXU00_02370 [Candidatus Nanoclepta minutus]|uniref:ATP-grasp domain-containing protein n=1 Tax=Candidatus Nanoclepta minutus TaxID=1940235 RepID=A0A397WMS4_9ARCH|nr:MAG: hypothetical protein BXU00_02370 [Candidatus Nanoclepta minutus]
MNKILVTGAGGPAGINVIKLLKKEYYIVSTDINPYSEGFAISNKYYLISPASNEEQFIKDIEKIIEEEKIDLVIPTVDEEIEVLAKNNISFSEKIVIHPREIVEICLNKCNIYLYLKDKIPEIIPEFSLDPKDLNSEKVVKKPIKGRGSRNIYIGNKNEFKKEDGFFFVEYLPGREWTVDAIADKNSNIIIAVPRIRLKVREGISMVGEVKLDKKILEYVKEISEYLKFRGAFNVQFKEDINGNPKLQEINLRFSGGLDITAAAGANLPKILVKYWLYEEIPNGIEIKEGIYAKVPEVYKLK